MTICLSSWLAGCHKSILNRNNRTNRTWIWACRLPSTCHTLCYKEIRVLPKLTVFPSGTLFRCLDLEKFATASKLCCQQNSSSSTVELVDDTYTTVDESWLFTTRRSTVTLLLHYFALLWICCTSSSCSCAAVDKILTDIARRAVRLR